MERYTPTNPEKQSSDDIVAVLRRHGVETLTREDLDGLPRDAWQRVVVWHIKEVPLNVEEVGLECFGDEWQEGVWI